MMLNEASTHVYALVFNNIYTRKNSPDKHLSVKSEQEQH